MTVKEMQRAFSSNGWYSKSRHFQKETALRAAEFVQSSLPFKKKTSKELIPEVHSLSLLRKGANFRGYKEVVVEL